MTKVLRVFDHTKYRKFEYDSEQHPLVRLGDVRYKYTPASEGFDDVEAYPETHQIGVVIQTFSDGDFRTDMWGMSSLGEDMAATPLQIRKYRPEIVADLIK